MSFSLSLKKEICQNRPFIYAHKQAVCLGLLLFGRSFDERHITLDTESQPVSRLYSELVYELVEIRTSITATEQILGNNRRLYVVTVDAADDRRRILDYFSPVYQYFLGCRAEDAEENEFLRGVLCGAFLSCANLSDPRRSYHLELTLHGGTCAVAARGLLDRFGIAYRETERRGTRLLYTKSSEEIEDVLTLLGAGKSALEVMNVKVYKDMRNRVNRRTNCETANLDRTISAGTVSAAQIRLIEETVGIDALPENLRQIARLRLENPDMPLSELAQTVSPPVSRSGAHYRLQQIARFSLRLSTPEKGGETL